MLVILVSKNSSQKVSVLESDTFRYALHIYLRKKWVFYKYRIFIWTGISMRVIDSISKYRPCISSSFRSNWNSSTRSYPHSRTTTTRPGTVSRSTKSQRSFRNPRGINNKQYKKSKFWNYFTFCQDFAWRMQWYRYGCIHNLYFIIDNEVPYI